MTIKRVNLGEIAVTLDAKRAACHGWHERSGEEGHVVACRHGEDAGVRGERDGLGGAGVIGDDALSDLNRAGEIVDDHTAAVQRIVICGAVLKRETGLRRKRGDRCVKNCARISDGECGEHEVNCCRVHGDA